MAKYSPFKPVCIRVFNHPSSYPVSILHILYTYNTHIQNTYEEMDCYRERISEANVVKKR